MLPQISNLVEKRDLDKTKEYLKKSLKFIMFFSIACSFGLMSISKEFTFIFLGYSYIRTSEIINFLSITIIFTGWANVIRTQWIIPNEKDGVYIWTTIVGAIVNFVVNLILIPQLGGIGAAIGTVVSEFLIMLLQSLLVYKEIQVKENIVFNFRYIVTSAIMYYVLYLVSKVVNNNLISLIVKVILGVIIYSSLNFKYIKDEILSVKVKKIKINLGGPQI